MTEKERAKQLASDHWGYVAGVIRVHGADEQTIKECGHHFTTAFEHAYGHAIEDERNGLFRPSIGEIAAIARPCSNCYDEKQCDGGLRLASGDCLHYRPKVSDQQHPRKESTNG